MTGALIVGGLILLTAAVFSLARISAARAEGRSIESYGHALGVLGDVTRRNDSSGNVCILPREAAGEAHVRTEGSKSEFPAPVPPRPQQPSSRQAPPAAPVIPRISLAVPARPLRFDDTAALVERAQPVRPPEPTGLPRAVTKPQPAGASAAFLGALWRRVGGHRLASASAAGIALLLATAGVLQLAGGGGHAGRAHAGTNRGHHTPRAVPAGGHSGRAGLDPSGAGQRLVPTSTTPSDVSFQVPSRSYLLTFSDTGTTNCWVGVETSAGSGGVWLWMETLTPGSTTSYKASGPVVADLGAPRNIKLRVNGAAAVLPRYAMSYYLSFTTGTASA